MKIRGERRVQTLDTKVSKQPTKIMLRHYNNYMVTIPCGKNFKTS